MDIPSDLDSYTIDQLYVIPQVVEVAANAEPFDDVPMRSQSRRGGGRGHHPEFGDSRWILLDATPAQVWPLVRDFWSRLNVVLDYESE